MDGQARFKFWRTCSRTDKKEHRAEQIKLFICVGIQHFSLRKCTNNLHTPMWTNVRQVHKLIWVIRLGFCDSPWADAGKAFQLMRKISLHRRKHPFLCSKKDHAHVSEWKGPETFIHWSGTRSFSLGIMRVRKPNTPTVRGATKCTASHGTRWDTGLWL